MILRSHGLKALLRSKTLMLLKIFINPSFKISDASSRLSRIAQADAHGVCVEFLVEQFLALAVQFLTPNQDSIGSMSIVFQ
jgi:hypothetical protein